MGEILVNSGSSPEAAAFLDPASPSYLGGILLMANRRLYSFWADLTEALRTGKPQNENKDGAAIMTRWSSN